MMMPVDPGTFTFAHTGVGLGVIVTVAVLVGKSVFVGVAIPAATV